jgi:hypothetical protein
LPIKALLPASGSTGRDMDIEIWLEGFEAGGRLQPDRPPYDNGTVEAWSWHRGYIEGAARRMGRRYSDKPPVNLEWPKLPSQRKPRRNVPLGLKPADQQAF